MMPYSAKLQQFVEEVCTHHGFSPKQSQVRLILQDEHLLVIRQATKERQVWLSRYVMIHQRPPVKYLEIVFFIDDAGHWIPYQYYRPPVEQQICGTIDRRISKLVIDNPLYQRALANQCDLWATQLRNQGWLEQGTVFGVDRMELPGELLWPLPTVDEPDEDQLEEWLMDGVCETTDGCLVELDGTCPHGHPSWILRLGLV